MQLNMAKVVLEIGFIKDRVPPGIPNWYLFSYTHQNSRASEPHEVEVPLG